MKLTLFLILFTLSNTSAFATTLSGVALLNKASMALRGIQPDLQDQKQIMKMTSEEQRSFINAKIDEYLSSQKYTQKMNLRLIELFQFLPSDLIEKIPKYYSNDTFDKNASTQLFSEMTTNNLSWDKLLTQKEYTLTSPANAYFSPGINDYAFYSNLISLPQTQGGYIADFENVPEIEYGKTSRISFKSDDPRIAGILSSPRFFNRYVTTGLNKNRRRAAAIFRVFLCDKMNASIPETNGIDDATFDLIYPGSAQDGFTEKQVIEILTRNDSIHGSRKDCKACHYKLDPMGQVFAGSGPILNSVASPGALVFKNSKGEIVNQPVNGLAELAEKITQQPDYVDCQIRHFWSWFIGDDITLTEERRQSLIQDFESVGRRTNDFVKKLILKEEFATRLDFDEIKMTAQSVKKLFKQCQTCHSNSADYLGPDLTAWPIGQGSSDTPDYWIKRISKVLDLPHSGLKRTMPPPPDKGGFMITKSDLNMITQWIALGAPDENGLKQINSEDKP